MNGGWSIKNFLLKVEAANSIAHMLTERNLLFIEVARLGQAFRLVHPSLAESRRTLPPAPGFGLRLRPAPFARSKCAARPATATSCYALQRF